MSNNKLTTTEFTAIKLKLASPEDILSWSHGEVVKPETINYRTQKPEKDGLFCERIFGPMKDWECYCGKYKKIRYKGIVCDKCGVEVTRAIVRRERMGHIKLATPVSHIWFLRGVPSRIGLMLDLSMQSLEKVIYFANFIVIKVDENLKQETLIQLQQEFKAKNKTIENEFNQTVAEVRKKYTGPDNTTDDQARLEEELAKMETIKKERLQQLSEAFKFAEKELKELKPKKIVSESVYQDLSLKYGHVFEADIGAEAVRRLLEEIDLEKIIKTLEAEIITTRGVRKDKLVRRIKLMKSLRANKIRPEWMVLTTVPIIPPDLRPMVQLDGGRFATSDLNDLYRRVINRNNRLKQLVELNAPEVICRNEKRMLQEAVDALIDNNARHGKTVMASTGQRRNLKSLADMLKGKQGRFRQNLLGKRVDYSGRSVIIVGPRLKLGQCGLPKRMALELFKPFVVSQLIKKEYVYNVRSANRFIDSGRDEVWDILENIVKDFLVLLNRAPTLHRLGIQAFQPVLIEGLAIRVHPLVCKAFNADFDGDQMAVHVPLTKEARQEADTLMKSTNNLLKPANGRPVVSPNQDLIWGCFYMTNFSKTAEPLKCFSSPQEAIVAYNLSKIKLTQKIKIQMNERQFKNELIETSVGRILFNQILPQEMLFVNEATDAKKLSDITSSCFILSGRESTVKFLDDIKDIGFKYLTISGLSWGMGDLPVLEAKKGILQKADQEMEEMQTQFDNGLLTDEEKYHRIIDIWISAKEKITESAKKALDPESSVYSIIKSGARASWGQLVQMMGIKGLVTNPAGRIMELPVRGSFKDGFNVLEFFISTHGTRKGLSDTALRTAGAGYLTRRLVDVAQEVIITEEDCHDKEGIILTKKESQAMGENLAQRVMGRISLEDIINPKNKKVIIKKGEHITREYKPILDKLDLPEIKVRSVISCKSRRGVCAKCYGYDLGHNEPVRLGVTVGVIAAQSIGEPGTQLTLQTFHTGGVAGEDITQGLPRVEELFEVRVPKRRALVSEVAGEIKIIEERSNEAEVDQSGSKHKVIVVSHQQIEEDKYKIYSKKSIEVKVTEGTKVVKGDVLIIDNSNNKEIVAKRDGLIKIADDKKSLSIIVDCHKEEKLVVPTGFFIKVQDGDQVEPGDPLTDGGIDLHQLHSLKGKEAVQRYLIQEIQRIYSNQGQNLNDKHLEVIARQIFSKVYIKDAGDTHFLNGEIIDQAELAQVNKETQKSKGKIAVGEELLLGITKVSLHTKSWLAAASFQETARVLISAAVTGKVDHLEGLKENVVIGRLIPAGTGFRKKVN